MNDYQGFEHSAADNQSQAPSPATLRLLPGPTELALSHAGVEQILSASVPTGQIS